MNAHPLLPGRLQGMVYVGIVSMDLVLVVVLPRASGAYFERFFGSANPVLVVLTAGVAGGVALVWLRSRFGFQMLRGRETVRGIVISVVLATALALAIVVADLLLRYPADINVPLPEALAFYPAVGLVAEAAFHVVPLALLLLAFSPLRGRLGDHRLVWMAIVMAAMLEPTFQVAFERQSSPWTSAYTWVHVGAIALGQLYVFRRYDFLGMYAFRLAYYAYWHIVWGTLRLELLF